MLWSPWSRPGWYYATATLEWPANNTGTRTLGLYKWTGGGYGIHHIAADRRQAVQGEITQQSVSRLVHLQQGEGVSARVIQTSGGSLQLANQPVSSLSLHFVSP